MDKLKKFDEFIYENNNLIKYDYITESMNIEKYQNLVKKFYKETKIQLYYALTFGTSLTVLLPVVDRFMKSGDFNIELNDKNIVLLTIYAFSVLVNESKDKINKIYQVLKERNIDDEDIKKSVNILRNIQKLFYITLEGTGKITDNFLDMVSYSGLLIPFLSIVFSLTEQGKISPQLMSGTFQSLSLTIGAIGLKLLINRIVHKFDKIIRGTNKFQNKDNIKPLIINDEFKSPMYKSENTYIKNNI